MDSMESCVPPGFRFHPTDEELVGYYLKKKVASQKIDLDVIRDIDLYRIEPWDLQERCRIGYEEQSEWYFFSHKDKKYPTGTRTNRATMAGFWKATGRDKSVHDKSKLIGMRKTLVFYKGRAPNGQKTDWIMHEYRLESEENAPPQEEGWVVCRAFKKRTTSQPRTTVVIADAWDSTTYCSFDDHHRISGSSNSTSMAATMVDPSAVHFLHHHQHQQQHHPTNLFCKQETELEALALLHSSNQFAQLPPLESPTLPLIKQPTAMSSLSMLCENDDRVTDWRALDKFVASQLSQEDGFGQENEAEPCLVGLDNGGGGGSDMAAAMLLLEEGSTNFDELLGSDIGTCIFEK